MEENKFENLNISKDIKRALADENYINTTEIQGKAIPHILNGSDLIGQSHTGTGKTAAFALPVLENIDKKANCVQAVILCPTRELAVQVTEEIRKFSKYSESIKMITLYGGQAIERQIMGLKKGVKIVIGTPGRVMDHLRRKTLKLDKVKMVVLDEADEMLNMGFEEDIETILKEIPEERQTLLFSATMNKKILVITKKYLKNPVHIKIKQEELTVDKIEQIAIDMKRAIKDESVIRLLEVNKPKKAIIFCNTKKKVDQLIEFLKTNGYKTEALHSDVKQNQRERIMKNFKNQLFQVLVATDVAARGLDIDDLELVINYDIPQEEEYYVHRIGRTGRNGKTGKSITFVVGKEKVKLQSIEKYAKTKIKYQKIPTITEINNIKENELVNKIQGIIDSKDFVGENILEKLYQENLNIELVTKALLTMIIGKKEKIKEEIRTKDNVKLFLNLGKKDKIMVKDIVGSLASNVAISKDDIGKVNILDNFSFVDVSGFFVEEIITKMKGKQIKGRNVNIEIANA